MRKAKITVIVVGFAILQSPIFLFGWMYNDWVGGAYASLELSSCATAVGSIIALSRATTRALVCAANR